MTITIHVAGKGPQEVTPLCREHYSYDRFALLLMATSLILCEHCGNRAFVVVPSPKEGTKSAAHAGGENGN